GLKRGCRQSLGGESVVVRQGASELDHRQAHLRGDYDHLPPGGLRFGRRFGEVRIEQQVLKLRVLVERFLDSLQKRRPDDAAAAPKKGDIAILERPLVLD